MEVAAVAAGAGMILSSIGQVRQGYAESHAANYNAEIKEQQAEVARDNAREEARRHDIQTRKIEGANRASIGASGLSIEGSALDILEENAMNAELDKLQILHAGELKAHGFEADAQLDRYRGANAKKAGYYGGAASLLSGAGRMGAAFA